jgi:hypothetical protein
MTRDSSAVSGVARAPFVVGWHVTRWPRKRLAPRVAGCVALCSMVLLGGCSVGDSVPPGRWTSAFTGTTSLELSDDGSATIDFGTDGIPGCVDSGAGVSDVGTWHGTGDGWYEAEFDTFSVEFAFDVWFEDTNYDKMFLAICGDRDAKVTLAKQ